MTQCQRPADAAHARVNGKTGFASATLAGHLLRGALGVVALAAAISMGPESAAASLALGGVALLAFRGCPLCWTVGLFETVVARLKKGQSGATQ
jgi:hypothetical protein